MSALVLENINVILGKGTPLQRHILKDLNLELKTSEFLLLIGGNGAGKSTLFHVISGTLPLDSGRILLAGQDISKQPSTWRAAHIARVLQDPRLGTMEHLTLEENCCFALQRGKQRGLGLARRSTRRAYLRSKLQPLGMGLEDRLESLAMELSGGQRQALSLMMALLAESKILLLDEICAALDPEMATKIMALTEQLLREEKRSTLMITHSNEHIGKIGDRTLRLVDGNLKE